MRNSTIALRDRLQRALIGGTCLLALLACTGCWRKDSLPAENSDKVTIQLTSSEFAAGEMIPTRFTCDGLDRSPPLAWSGVPPLATSLTLICEDPDAPMGTWSHWVIFNLAPETNSLKEEIPREETITLNTGKARQCRNDFGKIGYGGPCPSSGTHRYFFRLFALDTMLELRPAPTRADVLEAMHGHILAEGRLIAKYQRGGKEE